MQGASEHDDQDLQPVISRQGQAKQLKLDNHLDSSYNSLPYFV